MKQEFSTADIENKSRVFLKIAQEKKVAKLASGLNQEIFSPFTMILEPFKIKKAQFEKLKRFSELWQKITHLASFDADFITSSLRNLTKDPMIGPMLQIFQQTLDVRAKSPYVQKKLGLHKPSIQLFRTDFFITPQGQGNIKLIQYNNMSVSMAGISRQFQFCQKTFWGSQKNIIENKCTQTHAQGLANFYTQNQFNGILLAVVKQHETNVMDQGLLFEQISKRSNIVIKKVFLQNLENQTQIDQNGDLIFQGNKVSIVYYRAGYSSSENIDWNGVRKCNLSNSVNIPSIGQFLIGTKKMQAQLSNRQTMRKYLTEQEAQFLMQSVIDTWDFQAEDSKQRIIKMIETEGVNNFILKPNQEGGRNNLFGQDAYEKIKQLSPAELVNYILTRRISSRKEQCTLVRSKQWDDAIVEKCQIQSEVSIYGCIYSGGCKCTGQKQCSCQNCPESCLKNSCDGYLVRCKPEGVNEGGLMAGTGAICGLQLIDQKSS